MLDRETPSKRRIPALVDRMISIAVLPGDERVEAGLKRMIVAAVMVSLVPNTTFTILLFGQGLPLAGLSLLAMEAMLIAMLVGTRLWPRRWEWMIHFLIGGNLVVITVMTVLFGGLAESGSNFAWGFAAVLAGIVVFRDRRAMYWLATYIVLMIGMAVALADREGRYTLPNADIQGAVTLSVVAAFVFLVLLHFVRQRDRLQHQSDGLLRNVLPDEVAERLKTSDEMIADHFDQASILFADVVGFTPLSATMSPSETVELLNDVFSEFDRLVRAAGLEKIKTIGDEYMVAAGVPSPRPDHAHAIARLALAMQDFVESNKIHGHRLVFRIGINSGPVVAGIIGTQKFAYDLWGDAVNTASRMESHGEPGVIQISEATYRLIKDEFRCEDRGSIEVKGKGPISVWYLRGASGGLPEPGSRVRDAGVHD